jgi:hypothetical protein
MNERPAPTQRVSSIPFPERFELPAKPDGAVSAQDAFRQTTFVLRDDLRLFEEGMNLQLRIVQDASHSSFRKHPYAALIGLWSRTFSALSDACLLATRASYESCAPLTRAACEYIAAQHQLHAGEMDQFLEWLAGSLTPDEAHKATDIGMGRYFAGETLAADARLRSVYRPASELGRPNFGATLLEVGPESNNVRLALTFADTTFHMAWAELVLGWLLALCERQLAVVVHANDVFPIHEDTHRAYADFARRVDEALVRSERCRIEEVEVESHKRYLVYNFRRQPSGAPKKMLL